MKKFKAELRIIGINPFVHIPDKVLQHLFRVASKDKGPIRVCGTVNDKPFKQTLVRYKGDWRLYINMTILPKSPKRIGEVIEVAIAFDPETRAIEAHPLFVKALSKEKSAKKVFDQLPAYRQMEIMRYLNNLKTEESLQRNITRALAFLKGEERFVGRDKPQ